VASEVSRGLGCGAPSWSYDSVMRKVKLEVEAKKSSEYREKSLRALRF
jgi:hypothetical protein